MSAATKKAAHKELFLAAHEAGMEAGQGHRPEPMHVVERANPLDDSSPITRRYAPVMDGVCGFAWIKVRPATSSFARWLKAEKDTLPVGIHSGYRGGLDIWVRGFDQSYERKMAYATAFADVLREAGLNAFADGRLD